MILQVIAVLQQQEYYDVLTAVCQVKSTKKIADKLCYKANNLSFKNPLKAITNYECFAVGGGLFLISGGLTKEGKCCVKAGNCYYQRMKEKVNGKGRERQ